MASAPAHSVPLLGVRVDDVTFGETLALFEAYIASGRPHQVCTVNPEFIVTARHLPAFAAVLQASDLNLPEAEEWNTRDDHQEDN